MPQRASAKSQGWACLLLLWERPAVVQFTLRQARYHQPPGAVSSVVCQEVTRVLGHFLEPTCDLEQASDGTSVALFTEAAKDTHQQRSEPSVFNLIHASRNAS